MFAYDPAGAGAEGAYPTSLSMPLALQPDPNKIEPYLWGLLPDNEMIIERWARRFGVSARNAFALMTHVGEDCAGAVRFVKPDCLGEITAEVKVRSIGWMTMTWPSACADYVKTRRRGGMPTTPGNSAWQVRNRKPRSYLTASGGVPSGRPDHAHPQTRNARARWTCGK